MKAFLILALLASGAAQAADNSPNLRTIMQDLSQQMQKGADAISREDWAALALIAPRIAEHPAPAVTEKVRILTALGSDATRFRELDHQTHRAAEEMAEAARKGDGMAVIAAYARVQTSCMACHQGFRARVRAALGAP